MPLPKFFAQGAVSILKSIPAVKTLAFGSEVADGAAIEKAAEIFYDMNVEGNGNFRIDEIIEKHLAGGQSYKRSLALALEELGAKNSLVTSPNGILAIEYARAIKKLGANIEILPIERVGAGYGDVVLKDNFSSASAIRANLNSAAVAGNVPQYVLQPLKEVDIKGSKDRLDCLIRYALASADKRDMMRIFGCTEGLENKLKSDTALPPKRL